MSKEYNVGKLLRELQAEGLAVDAVNSNGVISWVNYRPGDNGEVGEVPIDLKIKAQDVIKKHDPIERARAPFQQEFLLQAIKLDKQDNGGRLKKLQLLLTDPLLGTFLIPCLNATGTFDEELIQELKAQITKNSNLGAEFWEQLSEVYAKVKDVE